MTPTDLSSAILSLRLPSVIPITAHFPYFDADRLFARPLIARPTSIAAHFQYSTSHLHIFAQSSARCSYPTAPTCLRRPTFQGVTFSALTFLHWLRLHRPCVLEVYIFTDLRFKEHVMNIPSNCTISHKLFKANFHCQSHFSHFCVSHCVNSSIEFRSHELPNIFTNFCLIRFVASLEWTGVPIFAVAGFCSTWYELDNIWNYSLRHVVIAAGLFVKQSRLF